MEAVASEPALALPAGVTGAAGEKAATEGGVPGEAAVVVFPSPSPPAAIAPCLRLDEARIAGSDGSKRRARYERARVGAAPAAIALTRTHRRRSGSYDFVVVPRRDSLRNRACESHRRGCEHHVTGFPYKLYSHIKIRDWIDCTTLPI